MNTTNTHSQTEKLKREIIVKLHAGEKLMWKNTRKYAAQKKKKWKVHEHRMGYGGNAFFFLSLVFFVSEFFARVHGVYW